MKKFRYKLSPLLITLLFFGVIISSVGIVFDVISVLSYLEDGIKLLTYIAILLLALLVLTECVLCFFARYKIKNRCITLWLGLIKIKYDLEKIENVTKFLEKDKLVAYFKDGTYSVIVIKSADFDDFCLSVKEKNKNVLFDLKK